MLTTAIQNYLALKYSKVNFITQLAYIIGHVSVINIHLTPMTTVGTSPKYWNNSKMDLFIF